MLAGLLYLLITSRWFPSSALVELWWPLEIIGWLAVLVTLALLWDSVRSMLRPQQHDAITRLRDHELSPALTETLVVELAEAKRERHGSATFLPNFVLVEHWANYAIIPIDWIVWAYAKKTEHRKYGVLHVRSSHEVYLALRNGERYRIPSSSSDCDNQLLCCKQRNPEGMLVGYDEALDKAWSDDADQVIRDIDALAALGELERGPAALPGAALRMTAGQTVDATRKALAASQKLLSQRRESGQDDQ
ncbi:DUF6709 family protein [Pseudenhygromyxa sp. WMMC2535]|uniref:DUF6709 family protein n=1 Tax=Pseudenhygromyxa sp. WMMC2535 TaxID=2712867 RepID=UPI0015535FBE|nr:DUF6709 family protein [Pseudenhygromyxa sp. WMMC2535]